MTQQLTRQYHADVCRTIANGLSPTQEAALLEVVQFILADADAAKRAAEEEFEKCCALSCKSCLARVPGYREIIQLSRKLSKAYWFHGANDGSGGEMCAASELRELRYQDALKPPVDPAKE